VTIVKSTERTMTADPFNPASKEHIETLTAMYTDYLLEELDRTGHMVSGTPVAGFLRTAIIRINEDPAGFFSADLKRCSIELIYVKPEFRGQGVAALALAHLAHGCPRPMALKAPLSPGGQILAERLGLGVAESTPEEIREADEAISAAEQALRRRCQHKRVGNPQSLCKRCYRAGLRKYARTVVGGYSAEARALTEMTNKLGLV
jgi:GNAT superfamily N-acetyltransferase